MAAATIAGIVLFAFGGSEAAIVAQPTEATDGPSALLLLSLVVVILAALRGRHLIEALTYGIVTAVAIGVAIGHLELSQLVHIPQARGESTGLIQDGISGVVGAIIFVLLLLGITQVVSDSGLMERLLVFLQRAVIKTVRQSEMAIIWITILISIPVSANAPAELLVGPTLVRPLGERFKLAPARRANLMDCAVCSVFYMLPWHLAVMVWHHQIELAATQHDLPLPEIGIAFYNPYSWAILAVILFSAYTGWNRRFMSEDAS